MIELPAGPDQPAISNDREFASFDGATRAAPVDQQVPPPAIVGRYRRAATRQRQVRTRADTECRR